MNERDFLQLQQRQEQRLSAQQIQSIAILQMNTQDLLSHIDEVVMENPMLDREPEESGELQALLREAGWRDVPQRISTDAEESQNYFGGYDDPEIDGLSAFLADQLSRRHLPKEILRCCLCMVAMLDDNGYLLREDRESIEGAFSLQTRQASISILQQLEPVGIGAADLSECLCIQLRRLHPQQKLALEIAQHHLARLGRQQYRAIALELHVSEAAVRRAAELIATLEPHPGKDSAPREPVVYTRPDVYILPVDGTLRVVLADMALPRLSLNNYYTELLRTTDDEETKHYLRQKQQQAKNLMSSIHRRGETLRRCAEEILRRQYDFFMGRVTELRPVTGQMVAEELGVHPSTVSRTLQGKYLQCPQGVYPLQYFCSAPLPDERNSRQAACRRILDFVKKEDREHPYSDPTLQRLLQESGITLSRRTVTKYRLELGIPSVSQRRGR